MAIGCGHAPEPEKVCKTCFLYTDGWQGSPNGFCLGEMDYREPDSTCHFYEPRRPPRPYSALDTEEDSFE